MGDIKMTTRRKRDNVYPRGTSWLAKVRRKCPVTGKMITRTKTFPNRTEAKEWARDTERAIRRGAFSGGESIHTLEELFAAYAAAELTGEMGWHHEYRRYLGFWSDHLGGETAIQAVTPDAIVSGLARLRAGEGPGGKPLMESSTRNWYTPLCRAFHLAEEWGWLLDNPTRRVTRPAKPHERKRFLTQDELEALLAACREVDETSRLEFIVTMAVGTGIRKKALLNLRWRDIHLEDDVNMIIVTDKGRKTRPVPLVGSCLEMVRERAQQGVQPGDLIFSTNTLHYYQWNRVRTHAGLPDVRFHDLRHSYASQLVMRGAPLNAVQKLLGHSRIDQTSRYAHLQLDFLKESATRLEGFV